MPRLRINRLYADILQRNRNAGSQQLASQLQEAKWLIKNVQQRFDTILRVAQAIVDRQRHFFEHGEVAMRPLVLREIAEALDLHESTVSRVTTQKFMHTPRGIFELKYFFGSHVTTEAGGSASSTAIRALIKQLVSAENTRKPLSDGQISEILSQQGIVVARRTVAKYRESHADTAGQSEKDALVGGARMNLHLTGHHLEITPAIRDYVSSKLAAHHAPFRPRDRRQRDPDGGEAAAARSRPACTCAARTSSARARTPTCTPRSTAWSTSSTAPSSSTRKNPSSTVTTAPRSSAGPTSS